MPPCFSSSLSLSRQEVLYLSTSCSNQNVYPSHCILSAVSTVWETADLLTTSHTVKWAEQRQRKIKRVWGTILPVLDDRFPLKMFHS
ncbi:hypothetical protein GDO81_011553 [Engystomops pustulosus]|uniref:Uncharacterized protein n=1 Tax=Engystomops pustulosus TaxID=76066 RepID=A0AAV7BF07_ENGPU|nr:hypothetical protein GDO81_011553 [Engystomops pustulosus]